MTQVTCLCCRIVFVCEWVCLWVYVWAAETGVLYNLWDGFCCLCIYLRFYPHSSQLYLPRKLKLELSISFNQLFQFDKWLQDSFNANLSIWNKNTAFRIRQPAKLGNYFWWLSNSFHYKDLTSQVRPWETFGKKFWYHILR